MGYPQQTFDFDESHGRDLQKLLTFIDFWIADNDQVMLDSVVHHFSIQPDKWSETYILELLNTLFQNDKIHFIIDGKKILPENVKTRFSGTDPSKLQFLQAREIFSVVRAHLSEPAQWQYVEIIKPEKVEEPDLLKAQHLGEKLFGDVGVVSQNSLCRYLRRHLRMWKNDLEMFQKVAGKGQYPGTNEIQKGLTLTRKLLNVHDPCKFIETFINNEDQFCDAGYHFAILEHFYKNQIYMWEALIKAVKNFEPNRTVLEKDPDVKKALETLCKITTDPKPYRMIQKVWDLISIVKPANDLIVEKQMASAKALAVEKIEKKIDKIVKILDKKKANSDIRNKVLFPLQTIKKKINMASSIQIIADFLDEATAQFDDTVDMLDFSLL
jgi:hypothetical protein